MAGSTFFWGVVLQFPGLDKEGYPFSTTNGWMDVHSTRPRHVFFPCLITMLSSHVWLWRQSHSYLWFVLIHEFCCSWPHKMPASVEQCQRSLRSLEWMVHVWISMYIYSHMYLRYAHIIFIYVYVYVYMCIYIYIYIYVCMYVCMYIYIYVYTYVLYYIYIFMCVCNRICV